MDPNKKIFTSQGVIPGVYQKILDDALTPEWITWELITIYDSIKHHFGVEPSVDVKNKLAALKLFYTTDRFYHDARAFSSIVLAVNDKMVRPEVFELVAPEDLTYAFIVLNPDVTLFEREIYAYIKACMEFAGLLVYPKLLSFAQPVYPDPLKNIVNLINPAKGSDSPDEGDIVAVQSSKLKRAIEAATEKLSHARLENLLASID